MELNTEWNTELNLTSDFRIYKKWHIRIISDRIIHILAQKIFMMMKTLYYFFFMKGLSEFQVFHSVGNVSVSFKVIHSI